MGFWAQYSGSIVITRSSASLYVYWVWSIWLKDGELAEAIGLGEAGPVTICLKVDGGIGSACKGLNLFNEVNYGLGDLGRG